MPVLTRVYSFVFDTTYSSAKHIVEDHIETSDHCFLKEPDNFIEIFRYAMGRFDRAINESNCVRLKGIVLMIYEVMKLTDK